MAKRSNSVSFKGVLNTDNMEIVENTKSGEFTYDILQELKNFNGKLVSFTIKEEFPAIPKE